MCFVATEHMSSAATEDTSSVATDMFSVATEDLVFCPEEEAVPLDHLSGGRRPPSSNA